MKMERDTTLQWQPKNNELDRNLRSPNRSLSHFAASTIVKNARINRWAQGSDPVTAARSTANGTPRRRAELGY
jgi:hypothetical protein